MYGFQQQRARMQMQARAPFMAARQTMPMRTMGMGAMSGFNIAAARRAAPFVPRGVVRGAVPVGRGTGIASVQRFPQGVGEIFLPFLQFDRRLPELCRRYPKLFYSQDLTRVLCHWVDIHDSIDIPLNGTTSITINNEQSLQLPDKYAEPEPTENDNCGDRYFARVILLSPKPEETEEEKKPDDQTPKPPKVPTHPWQRIRFVLALNAKGHRVPYGGEWCADDGEDPKDPVTLLNTAVRLSREQCGIDLSSCAQWYKILETQYRRKNGATDYSFFYLPDVWSNNYQGEVYKGVANEYKEEVEEVEEEVEEEGEGEEIKMVTKKVQKTVQKAIEKVVFTPIETTLQALIEQNTHETGEPTVEASLFAASIDELLGYRYANKLLTILRKKKQESDETNATLKRKREEDTAERESQQKKAIEEMEAKRRKIQEETSAKEAWKAARLEEEKDMAEEEIQKRREEEAEKEEEERKQKEEEARIKEEEAKQLKEEEARKKQEEAEAQKRQQEDEDRARGYSIVKTTHTLVDEEVAAPFQYFDRPSFNTAGQLRRDTLEGVLHALGNLTQREIEGLLRGIGLPPDKPTGPIFYRRLAGYTVVEEKQVPLSTENTENQVPVDTPMEA